MQPPPPSPSPALAASLLGPSRPLGRVSLRAISLDGVLNLSQEHDSYLVHNVSRYIGLCRCTGLGAEGRARSAGAAAPGKKGSATPDGRPPHLLLGAARLYINPKHVLYSHIFCARRQAEMKHGERRDGK